MRLLLLLLLIGTLTAPAYAQSFDHGVASGDPTESAVVIWTRTSGPGLVDWWVSEDPTGANPVRFGFTTTDAGRDFTVKIDVGGLAPASTYYYGFSYEGIPSQVGRTRTAPTGTADRIRIAVASCAQWEKGYFNAYRRIAERDLDLVLHLGDYIYEMATEGASAVRPFEPAHEIVTLADYRARYASYRTDPDLQAAHAAHPWIVQWDDHEFANNAHATGAPVHDPATEGPWGDRVSAAKQAFFEWLPLREVGRAYRTKPYGGLLDLFLLETRLDEREEQVAFSFGPVADPEKRLISEDQFSWLFSSLATSSARWKLIASPVPIFPQRQRVRKTENWEGFPAQRERLFEFMRWSGVSGIVAASGDIHSAWATDLPDDFSLYSSNPAAGSVGTEFVAPGIAALSLASIKGVGPEAETNIARSSPHVRGFDLRRSGYVVLDLTPQRVRGDFWFVDGIDAPTPGESLGFSYLVNAGEAVLRPTTERQARPRRGAPRRSGKPETR